MKVRGMNEEKLVIREMGGRERPERIKDVREAMKEGEEKTKEESAG